jgi:uncharacterized RDD family membrane protein YckC
MALDPDTQYGGFWRRFGAMWVDGLCLLPLSIFYLWAETHFRLFFAWYLVPGALIGILYEVCLVRRYGGTPGKLALNLQIRRLDGSPVGYREAFLRYAPLLVLNFLAGLGLALSALQMNDAEYFSLGFQQRAARLNALAPAWYHPLTYLQGIWFWGEFIVLLTNRQRRAIHDFIAGTVVIVQRQARRERGGCE